MSAETRIIGFVILMVAVLLGAYKAGSLIGPVIPANAPVQAPGRGTPPAMNMNMGVGPAQLVRPAIRPPDHR
jgi:hypothetical protein